MPERKREREERRERERERERPYLPDTRVSRIRMAGLARSILPLLQIPARPVNRSGYR